MPRTPFLSGALRRTAFPAAVAAALLAAALASAGENLLIGVSWPNDPSPSVSALLYETGFNYARITGGGYGWAVESHARLANELEAHGVKVLLQLGSHYPSADYFKFKDSWFVDHKGGSGVEDRNAWAISYSGQAWPQ